MATPEVSFGKLLGVIHVEIGKHVFDLPVEAVQFFGDRDSGDVGDVIEGETRGGFFDDGHGHFGILVSSDASPDERDALIKKATADAVVQLSRRALN